MFLRFGWGGCCRPTPEILAVFVLGPDLTCSLPADPKRQSKFPLLGVASVMKQLFVGKKFVASVVFRDKAGNPAATDGVPEWATDNSDVLSVIPSDDGMSCTVKANGPLGTAKVQVMADADLGEGKKVVVGVLEVSVSAGEATVVEVASGDLVDDV